MTQVGRAADWTVAAAAVLSGQYPEREQKKTPPVSGWRSNYAHLTEAKILPPRHRFVKILGAFTNCSTSSLTLHSATGACGVPQPDAAESPRSDPYGSRCRLDGGSSCRA